MTELPNGWANATINELIAGDGLFLDGDWVETKDQDPVGEVRLTQLADVGEGRWRDRSHRYMTAAAADRLGCTFLQVDDVLVARMPDPLGRASVFPGDPRQCVTVVDVAIVRPGSASVLPAWLMWAINAPTTRIAIEAQQAGTTRKRISRKNLGEIELPVPPRSEQGRIVTAIEEAFSKLDAGEAGLRTVRQLLKRMREAVLAAAVTGRLVRQHQPETAETGSLADAGVDLLAHDQGGGPASWTWAALGDLVEPRRRIAYGVLQPGNDFEGGVPMVRVMDLVNGSVAIPQLKRINPAIASKFPRTALVGGEVLVSVVGTIGRVAVASSNLRGANVARAVAVLPLRSDAILPEWIVCALRHEPWRRALEQMSHEVARKTLNLEDVRRFPVPVPPVEEQARIVAEAERQFSFIEACERAVDAGLVRSASLRRSVLKAAFEGRLVPQDSSDEPASVLLERIRAEHSAADESGGGRRRKKVEAS